MSFLDTLRQWDEATTCVDRQDLPEALNIFLSIQEPNSKIYFDIGCLHLLNQDLDAAEKAFDCSIRKDEHLAVAFFQRGITFYRMERYDESLADFQHAYKALRGNQLIDYKALGLRYKLYACEVLHNRALAEAHLGNWEKAQETLVEALDDRTDAKLNVMDRALQSVLKQKLFKPVEFPFKVLFKPNKHYVAELEKKDYLGKAKVVASVIPQDRFSGFAPLQPQVESGPTCPKEPEVLRALEGEPHTVLFQFVPETSDELAVVPGNIVFVLQKAADNWASVLFNERRGLVPYNYLERLEISLASKQNDGISEPPTREPPTRPQRKQGLTPSGGSSRDAQPEETQSTGTSCIVKVRSTFDFAVSVPIGSSNVALVEKISRKLNRSPAAITLSSSSERETNADGEMERVWSRASGGRIVLWCKTQQGYEQKDSSHQEAIGEELKETHFLALHSYESSSPEDLSFHQGDKIMFLSQVNTDWVEGQCNGNTGIFPSSFVGACPVDQ
ncbi:neutrophil cytosol factor 2 [Brachionichthys hirsutus]|uniref:neutrophil cytosol factor 2 n=1 Tax=Brachionichthys hirsutus TaxID=412623 RepID=UPI00360540E3